MAKPKYAFQGMKESMARAMKRDAELSIKVAIEMSSFLKGRTTTEAKNILERVLQMRQAIPFKKFTNGVGHRKGAGIAAGRYPQKASVIFTELIESAEANAQAKGLSSNLKIIHLAPQKTSGAFHYGRLRRRKFKRTHMEIVVQEVEKDEKTMTKSVERISPASHSTEKKEKIQEQKAPSEQKEEKETTIPVETNTEKPEKKEKKAQSETKKAPVKKKESKKTQEDKQ